MMAGPTTGRGTVRRLFREIRLSPSQVGGLILCALCGVAASAVAPLLVGRAVDVLVAGAIARGLPAGLTPDEALRNLREQGRDGQAEVLSSLDFVPGSGVDVAAFAGILLTALALFGAAALLNWCTEGSAHLGRGSTTPWLGRRCTTSTDSVAGTSFRVPRTTSTS